MKIAGVPATRVQEGAARLWVPAKSFSDPHHCPVFYNPRMRFNRSLGSLAVGALAPNSVLDALCATGARGIRYARENTSVRNVAFVEANPPAVAFLRKNVRENKLGKKARVWGKDFHAALAGPEKFDWMEVDPFGTAVFYLETAARRLSPNGVLAVTSTDLANLCAKPRPTLRYYQAVPVNNAFAHETALRILVGKLARTFAQFDQGIRPLLCYYEGHYARAVVQNVPGAAAADAALANVRVYDDETRLGKGKRAGPLWLGPLCDARVLEQMRALNEERAYEDKDKAAAFLTLLLEENGLPPFFYDAHALARRTKKTPPKMSAVLERLHAKGFRAVRTHFTPTGFRTDAPAHDVQRVFRRSR